MRFSGGCYVRHETMSTREHLSRRMLVGAIVGGATLLASTAFANAANPTSTDVSAVRGADGTVTDSTWEWPSGQTCSGRYETGWVVGWWGIGSTSTPSALLVRQGGTR